MSRRRTMKPAPRSLRRHREYSGSMSRCCSTSVPRSTPIAAKASRGGLLSVGFLGDATEADGTSTGLVAAVNEFGGTIPERQVDEHTVTISRKLLKDGFFANAGRFVKRAKSNFEQQVTVPAHTIPAHKIPPR